MLLVMMQLELVFTDPASITEPVSIDVFIAVVVAATIGAVIALLLFY